MDGVNMFANTNVLIIKPKTDYFSQVFGMLTVIDLVRRDCKSNWWLVRCECGIEKELRTVNFTNPNNISFGCFRRIRGNKSSNCKGAGMVSGAFLQRIKVRCTRTGLDFDLTVEYLWELFEKQNGRCATSGLPLNITKIENKDYQPGNASVDRIDSNLGYVPGNVQWTTIKINFMKQALPQEEFISLCKIISQQNEGQ